MFDFLSTLSFWLVCNLTTKQQKRICLTTTDIFCQRRKQHKLTTFLGNLGSSRKKMWTPEELKCEEHFKATTKRRLDGQFVVKLPFKEEVGLLGDSIQQAGGRLRNLLSSFDRNPELYKKYNNFINKFINLGHMEEIPDNGLVRPHYNCFYMPHHCVFKDSSTTTKLRVVFDASARPHLEYHSTTS